MRTALIRVLIFIIIIGCTEEEGGPTPTRSYYVQVIDAISSKPIEGAALEIVSCFINVGPIGPPCCRMGSLNDPTKYYTNSRGYAKVDRLADWDEECLISHTDYLQRKCEGYFVTSNCWKKIQYSYDTASIEVYGLYPKAEIQFTYKGNYNLPDTFRTVAAGSTLIEGIEKCSKSMVDSDPFNKNIDNNQRIIFRANRDTTFNVYVIAEKVLELNFGYYTDKEDIQYYEPIHRKSLSISVPRNSITTIEIPSFD